MRVYTSLGHKGSVTIYMNKAALMKLLEWGFPGHDGAVTAYINVDVDGIITLAPSPANLGDLPFVIRKFGKYPPDEDLFYLGAGHLSEHDVTMAIAGPPWRKTKVSDSGIAWNASQKLLVLHPPAKETRLQPPNRRRKSSGASTKSRSEGILFLGSFPDGSPISFRLNMALCLKFLTWLQEHDVEVGYERDAEQGE